MIIPSDIQFFIIVTFTIKTTKITPSLKYLVKQENNNEKPKVIKPKKIWEENVEDDKTPTIDEWIDSQPGYEELKKRLEKLRRENWEKDDEEYKNYEEKDIKNPEIPSPFQYSENSNNSELEKQGSKIPSVIFENTTSGRSSRPQTPTTST